MKKPKSVPKSKAAPRRRPAASSRADAAEMQWRAMYHQLVDFHRLAGHCDVPRTRLHRPLAAWLQTQRAHAASHRLPPARVQALTELGVDLDPGESAELATRRDREDRWTNRFEELTAYRQQNGHTRVPKYWRENPSLATWVQLQRQKARQGQLPADRLLRLDTIGFDWDPGRSASAPAWAARYEELLAFKARFGHTRVPSLWPENFALGSWRYQQRKQRRQGKLPPEREAKLTAIGFEWEEDQYGGLPRAQFLEVHWHQRLADLRAFRKRHGHCRVTPGLGADPSFTKWITRVRREGRDGHLPPERRRALDKLGFHWSRSHPGNDLRWAIRYEELRAFQKLHGHTRVPASWQENPPLGSWIYQQRKLRRTGRLSPEHQALLERIHFSWEIEEYHGLPRAVYTEAVFQQRLVELKAFEQRFGHCRVPGTWEENPALSKWVSHLRDRQKKGILAAAHRRTLEAAGFVWQPGRVHEDVQWERRCRELAAFHKRFGHTRVPSHWQENPPLSSWQYQQRKLRRAGRLSPQRIARLAALSFEWNIESR